METLTKAIRQPIQRPIKVLQFGEGNFLRAFIDWFIQVMNDTTDFHGNVAVVQPLPTGRVKELAQQDGLYTLLLEGISKGDIIHKQQTIDVLQDFINPYTDHDAFLAYACSKELTFIISNTTEAGILYDPTDLLDTCVSPSYPGKLLTFLKKRYDHFQGAKDKGLFILPCELIDHNGDTLREIMHRLAKDRGYDTAFCKWLLHANTWYNTLVDRIVPGYPKEQIKEIEARSGYHDANIVKGEIFHLWVLEGDPSITSVLPFEQTELNIQVTNCVTPFKERKVKILNGSHTCMVPIAYQCGIREVKELMEDPYLKAWLTTFLQDEVWPTIELPQEELVQFTKDVMERFSNPTIHHELLTIALNSMTKYKTRILPSAIDSYHLTGSLPKHALFSLAALCAMYGIKKEDGTLLIQDDPQFLTLWTTLWQNEAIPAIVDTIMMLPHWDYDFTQMKGSIAYVTQCLQEITTLGMPAALHKQFG